MWRFFVTLGFLFVLILSLPNLLVFWGDRLLVQDKISQARQIYELADKFNWYQRPLAMRLSASRVIQTERTSETEETSDKTLADNLAGSNVLGATATIPVLMYHYIRYNPYPTDTVGFNLSVTPENFAAQMDYLASHGYHTITLDKLGGALFGHDPLPPKPVVITLDDGYRDSYTAAYPVLRDRHLQAINFVITGFVGLPVYLTWDQIAEMKNSGVFTFGSHTITHRALPSLNDSEISKEVTQSRLEMEKHIGRINWFAYPYGSVDSRSAAITAKAGYAGAFGTNFGTFQSTDFLFTLPRVRIGGGDSVNSFAAKLPWH